MNRTLKLKMGLVKEWCDLVDEEVEVFIQERPFLVDDSFETEILDLSEQRKEIEIRKQAILKELNKL